MRKEKKGCGKKGEGKEERSIDTFVFFCVPELRRKEEKRQLFYVPELRRKEKKINNFAIIPFIAR
jgi:hypothetical protein